MVNDEDKVMIFCACSVGWLSFNNGNDKKSYVMVFVYIFFILLLLMMVMNRAVQNFR